MPAASAAVRRRRVGFITYSPGCLAYCLDDSSGAAPAFAYSIGLQDLHSARRGATTRNSVFGKDGAGARTSAPAPAVLLGLFAFALRACFLAALRRGGL